MWEYNRGAQMQVTILPGLPEILEGISKKTGRPYRMVKQAAILKHADGRVEAFTWSGDRVNGRSEPTAAGNYALVTQAYVQAGELKTAPRLSSTPGNGGTK
jgi:hypothetical protein